MNKTRFLLDTLLQVFLEDNKYDIINIGADYKMPKLEKIVEYKEISKEEHISRLIDNCAEIIKNIPKERIEQLKLRYIADSRSYEEIEQEILSLTEKVLKVEQLVNTDIDSNILENSIILIGPMGSGKSTIANLLCKKCNMPHVSLDSREQLSSLYEQRQNYDSFKEFEFFLTGTVLTKLPEPVIIDFGAGHSIYEDEALFLEMQCLMSRFDNVVLLMPSEDKEESIAILNERKGIESGSRQDFDNRHFVNMPCNYELATLTVYTKDKTPDQISNEIISQINQKESSNRKTL